jgi:hypothetical protein
MSGAAITTVEFLTVSLSTSFLAGMSGATPTDGKPVRPDLRSVYIYLDVLSIPVIYLMRLVGRAFSKTNRLTVKALLFKGRRPRKRHVLMEGSSVEMTVIDQSGT